MGLTSVLIYSISRIGSWNDMTSLSALLILLRITVIVDSTNHSINYCPHGKAGKCKFLLEKMQTKLNFGEMCEERGFTIAAELGVQTGRFSDAYLYTAPSTKKYILVDTWEQRSNYTDAANVDNAAQELIYKDAMKRLAPYRSRGTELVVIRNWTTVAALSIPDLSIDFIYVDARHDYCGVRQDIYAWWLKLKIGGIMAGDDYLTANEHLYLKKGIYDVNDDWGVCADGSKHPGAVKGAVNKFAKSHGLTVFNTWKHIRKEWEEWPNWIFSPKQ